MNKQKGFVTVATGSEQYYKVAANLLKSYRFFAKDPLPFAIIADKENEYTALFDDVIILDNPQCSYMDKVFILQHIPYNETLFVESDILVYKDITCFFDAFDGADDFSLFGTNHPVDADISYGVTRVKGKSWGWFDPQKMGEYQKHIHFIPQFGSGIVFLRKGAVCEHAWEVCSDIWKHADIYGLKPLDDELFATAMAITGCRCVPPTPQYNQCVYPHMLKNKWLPDPNLHKNRCYFTRPSTGIKEEAHLCHWGNIYTRKALYQREAKILECRISEKRIEETFWYAVFSIYIPLFNAWDSLCKYSRRIENALKRYLKG